MIKKRVRLSITAAFLFCAVSGFYGQTGNMAQYQKQTPPKKVVLTVDEAVKQAMDNSWTLKSAAIDLEMKRRTKNTAWSVFIPTLNVNGTVSRMNNLSGMDLTGPLIDTVNRFAEMNNAVYGSIPGYRPLIPFPKPDPVTPEEKEHWSAAASVSAGLNLSLALIDGVKATFASYEAGVITWQQTVSETEYNIRKLFYSILLMQENLRLQRSSLENARQRWEQAKVNFRNGLVPELTVLQSQVAYENKRPINMELEQSVLQQLDFFAFLLGYPYGTEIQLNGTIDPVYYTVNAQELINGHLGNRFDIITLKKNMELLRIQLSASRLQTYTPALALNYTYAPAISPITADWLNGDNWSDSRGAFSATLAWNLTNMLPFSDNAVKMRATADNIKKLEITLNTALQNAEMEINQLVNKMNKSRAAIEVQELNLQLAKKAYDLTVLAFNAGTRELLDVRDAESQMQQAELGLLQEKLNYTTAFLDLEYAINYKIAQ